MRGRLRQSRPLSRCLSSFVSSIGLCVPPDCLFFYVEHCTKDRVRQLPMHTIFGAIFFFSYILLDTVHFL